MTQILSDAIREVVAGQDLGETRSYAVACAIMEGQADPVQIGALLVALRMKGESVAEIIGFARAMRDRVDRVPLDGADLVDTCGTGGDGKGTFNVSTVCAFVAAGAGIRVAKHGNRSVSSRCGSAELLDVLGVDGQVGPQRAAQQIEEIGLAFLFAPKYHQATRHAVGPRRLIGVRSIFNIVGPLTNPADTKRQLLGVFDAALTEPLAHVLRQLGSTHCMVVHGEDGLDEISIAAPTRVSELRDGEVRSYRLDPTDLGLSLHSIDEVLGGEPEQNAEIALDVLGGQSGPARDIVLLNAGAVIYVGGKASSVAAGIQLAARSIDSGRAMATLEALRAP